MLASIGGLVVVVVSLVSLLAVRGEKDLDRRHNKVHIHYCSRLHIERPAAMNATEPVNCTCFGLRKAARAVTQMYDRTLKPTGLRTTQFSLLAVTDRVGPRGMAELAEQLVMDRTTLTRNLKPLLDRGLLESVAGADRRRRPIAITAKGRAALAQALPYWREAQARMTGSLGRARWGRLLGDLRDTVDLVQQE